MKAPLRLGLQSAEQARDSCPAATVLTEIALLLALHLALALVVTLVLRWCGVA